MGHFERTHHISDPTTLLAALGTDVIFILLYSIFGKFRFREISGNFDFRFPEIWGISGNFDFRFRDISGISGNFDFRFREIYSVEIEIGKRNLKRNIRQSLQYNNNERRIQVIEKFVHGSRNGVTIIRSATGVDQNGWRCRECVQGIARVKCG